MAESIKTTVVENLPENAAPGDADYIITAQKNILKKTKIAQLVNVFKEKLGINTLNTNLTTNISIMNKLGTAFCVYNSQFVYIHIGVGVSNSLASKDMLAILPSDIKVQAVPNIGVVSTTGNIASIAIENNIVYANPTFPQGNYFIDLVLKRA